MRQVYVTHTQGLQFVAEFTRPQHYAIQKLPIKNTMLSAHFLGIHYKRSGSGKEKGGMVWNTTAVLDFHACEVKMLSCPPPPAQLSFASLIPKRLLRPVANTRALAVKRDDPTNQSSRPLHHVCVAKQNSPRSSNHNCSKIEIVTSIA